MIRNLFAPLAMKIAGGIALALALALGVQTLRLSWAHNEIAEAERDKARAVAQALAQARKADAAGVETAEAGKTLSEAEIERAREAAENNPDDPWAAALEAIR